MYSFTSVNRSDYWHVYHSVCAQIWRPLISSSSSSNPCPNGAISHNIYIGKVKWNTSRVSGTRCLPRDHAVATRVLRRPHVYYTCVERTTWLVHAPAEDHVATSSLWKIPPGYYTRVERPTRLLRACEEYHTGRTSLWKNYTATTREWSGSHRYFSCVKGQHEFYTRVEMTPRLLHVCGEDHPATASWDENSIYVCKGYLHTCTEATIPLLHRRGADHADTASV